MCIWKLNELHCSTYNRKCKDNLNSIFKCVCREQVWCVCICRRARLYISLWRLSTSAYCLHPLLYTLFLQEDLSLNLKITIWLTFPVSTIMIQYLPQCCHYKCVPPYLASDMDDAKDPTLVPNLFSKKFIHWAFPGLQYWFWPWEIL